MGTEVTSSSKIGVQAAITKATDLKGALKALSDVFAPEVKSEPAKAPAPITDEQAKALAEFTRVFGVVVPTERRELTAVEKDNLLTEREEIDKLLKLIEPRKDAIRTIVYNHLDVEAERTGKADDSTPRDKNGFYILPGEVSAPNHEQKFKREPKEGTATLPVTALEALEAEGHITHAEFLKATRPVRVVEEGAVLELLKKKPELHKALAEKVTYVGRSAALNMRKA